MNSLVAALGISALLALAGVSLSLAPNLADASGHASHDASTTPHEASTSGHHGAAGAHPWEGGDGEVPTLLDSLTKLSRKDRIVIQNDSQFTPAAGVRSGSGSFDDPFVIENLAVDTILIKDTSKAFVIRNCYVSSILILDWTGAGGYVHHNHIENLRTNRNVERTGDPSATVIENNEIARVQELRHFDGEVRNNTIGSQDLLLSKLRPDVVFNIAGLNGAGIHDNAIFGGVDMKIHGHHHSDATGAHSHNHGEPDDAQEEDHVEDHQTRYVDFHFYRNRIVDDGFGVRYNDLNHAGDDRTATSEQEPALETPHEHHTKIAIHDNVIEGATLRIAVVNAQDERHVGSEEATLEIHNNTIAKPTAGDGITVGSVRNAIVRIRDNVVERSALQLSGTSAIFLKSFANTTVFVERNHLGDYRYGVRASGFDEATRWTVADNDAAGAEYPVYWDNSVANAPEDASGEPAHDNGHDNVSSMVDGFRGTDALLVARP